MTGMATTDLRTASLDEIRALDLRSTDRDVWADEAAIHDRLEATWAGLDAGSWLVPGAARSDAGGPDWSLGEHVGHLVLWQELGAAYTAHAVETGAWPSDADFDDGDYDRFNERHRAPWTTMGRDDILARSGPARDALLAQAGRLTPASLRADDAWSWVFMTLHGHYLDHLGIIEPWCATLRARAGLEDR